VHDYRNSHFRPITDGCATLFELFKILWNDLRGAYGPPALGPKPFRNVLAPVPNFKYFQDRIDLRTSPELMESPAEAPRDDLAA